MGFKDCRLQISVESGKPSKWGCAEAVNVDELEGSGRFSSRPLDDDRLKRHSKRGSCRKAGLLSK
jgi:hypothetical protein